MSEDKKEIYTQLHQNQNQFIYLILAVDVSAIGFTINKLIGMSFHVLQLFLAFAVICWSVSFLCGCYYIENKSKSMATNLTMFERPESMQVLKEIAEELSKKGTKRYNIMKKTLYSGALFFIIWILLSMAENSKILTL
jgi:hypothetical protein